MPSASVHHATPSRPVGQPRRRSVGTGLARPRRAVSAVLAAALALLGAVVLAPAAAAAVTPTFSLTAPADALQGGTFDVTFSARNPTATPAYNTTFRLVLPAGISVSPSTALPPTSSVTDGGTGVTTVIWTNVSDLLAGSPGPESALTVTLLAAPSRPLGTVPLSGDVYVSDDPRLLPTFAADGTVTGLFTGRASASASTSLVPFTITKSTAANEQELLRGVHDHRTSVTLTLENTTLDDSTGLEIVDYLPAGLEFLGCGTLGDDNSSAEEYAGSGPLNASSFALTEPCPTPSFVDTQTLDPDGAGPMASGVYTVIRWTTADLAAQGALAPGATTSLQYVVGVPQRANVPFPGGTPTTGVQASNLDNNTGPSTIETGTEQSATNLAVLTGTYDDPAPTGAASQQYQASATDTVTLEDVAIAKTEASNTAGGGSIEQGGTTVWNLLIRVSEYTTDVASLVVRDTVPDGLDVVSANPAATSVGAPAPDGTIEVTWNLTPPSLVRNDTVLVQLTTQTRATYRADAEPVRANDTWTNSVRLDAVATDRDGTVRALADTSSATQTGEPIRLIKQVSAPGAGATAIDRCESAVWPAVNAAAGTPPTFGPGDLVCWRLTVQAPDGLDTTNQALVDFLPPGFAFVAADETAGSAVNILTETVAAPRITWTFENNGNLLAGQAAQIVLATRIDDPTAAASGDIPGNLAKLTFLNTPEELFQLRAQADVEWTEPLVDLDKSVVITAPDTTVKASATGGDTLTYSLAVQNLGTVPVEDVEVRDLLPSRFACADVTGSSPAATGCTDAVRDYLDWTIADIAAGATVTLTYQVLVPDTVVPGVNLVNDAGVRLFRVATTDPDAPQFTYVPSSNVDPTLEPSANAPVADDTATVPVQAIGLTKTATTSVVVAGSNTAAQATPGEVITYTVTATLPAETTITAGALTDTVPATVTLDEGSVAVVRNDSAAAASFVLATTATQLSLTFPTPYVVGAVDEVVQITFDATVKDASGPVAGANVTNTARLNATGMTERTAAVSTRVVEPNIRVAKAELDADNRADPGELIGFTLTVTNPGPNASSPWTSTAYDNEVVDDIPTSMTPTDAGGFPLADGGAVPSGGVWDLASRTLTWTSATTPALGAVAPNGSVSLPYSVRVADPIPSPTTFTNTVAVTTTSMSGVVAGERGYTGPGGPSAARYRSTDGVTLSGPQPTLTKSVSPARAVPGQIATFTLRATIPPQVTTNNVTVLDTLPTGLTFVRTVSSSCTSAGACTLTPTALTQQGQRIGWTLGDAADQPESRVVEIVYEAYVDGSVVAVSQDDTLTNSALVRFSANPGVAPTTPSEADSLVGASSTVTATVTVDEPVVTLSKTVAQGASQVASRRVVPGETLTYSIALTNTGPVTAFDVVVDDVTDARFAAVTNVTGATVTDATPPSLRFTIPSIASGATATITYDVVVPALTSGDEVVGPELANTAEATYTSLAGLPTGARSYTTNDDTVTLEVDLASLGDTVWFDTDGNGLQGPSEPGVAGVDLTVRFAGADGTFGTGDDEDHLVTTDADGEYLVGNLPGGLYRVIVDASSLPSGTAVTTDLDGVTGGLGTAQLTLLQDDDRRDVDFGIRGTGTVGDLVWLDLDADGVQDSGEPGLAGIDVRVTWHGPDGIAGNADDVVRTVTTAADGSWTVSGMPAGGLTVSLVTASIPSGLAPASDPDGGTADGTADGTLAPGATDLTYDFGLRGSGLIGDRLWVDTNSDGVQDAGEPGIPGAVVEVRWEGSDGVLGTADDAVQTLTTGADGLYEARYLPAGDFRVTVVSLPTALAPTFDEDSGTTSPNGITAVALAAGEQHRSADFGYVAATGVGDRLWLDANNDGVQDPGEPGLPGVEVTVTSAGTDGVLGTADDIVRTTTTAADGQWLVTGLPAGLTRVEVTGTLPGGLTPTFDADGGLDGVSELVLVSGVTDLDQDFGYVGPNAIGDRTWVDLDRDGVQDAGEPGLGGLTVQVTYLGADGVAGGGDDLVLTTVTATDGSYRVPGLPDGDYTVVVTGGVPAGYAPTWDETGAADGSSVVVGLGVGTAGPVDHLTADFGYGGTGALGGTVWLERKLDGALDAPTEAGIPGIGIDVTWAGPDGVLGTPDDVVIRVVTGPGGVWLVEGMPPGPFVAAVDPTTLPAGTAVVWDRENGQVSPNGTLSGTLAPGERRLDVDTGVRGTSSIGDLVWVDTDRDGVRDPGEPGVGGVRVTLTWHGEDGALGGGDDVTIVVVTAADGTYLADGLPAGRYTVTFDRAAFPPGTSAWSDLDGGDPLVTTVDLALDQDRTDVDLVLRPDPVPPVVLPKTGAEVAGLGLLALLLVAAGVLLRRRGRRLEGAEGPQPV